MKIEESLIGTTSWNHDFQCKKHLNNSEFQQKLKNALPPNNLQVINIYLSYDEYRLGAESMNLEIWRILN